MSENDQRFDILWGTDGPRLDYHFCRTWEGDQGCYGTNPDHGYSWDQAREQVAQWHASEAERWRKMTYEEWAPPNDTDMPVGRKVG